ncbi:hypothetical protein MYRNA_16 [Mycobacterium phage Myrna]|uniref:Uncharacterized protein n=1 Tax=Mycobacterium phage Myrna TaxID=546805 RepID=B5LJ27_9CAUD|nr:gp16 [Mycobacterium phage Myrna]ACH62024.1 hypothetical protein MYRNA_16 [Mycobacterium phage Myrna]
MTAGPPPYDIDWLRQQNEQRGWDNCSPRMFFEVLEWALALHDQRAVEEFHQEGSIGITNLVGIVEHLNEASARGEQVDVGLQVAEDGRIWLCVDGAALIRFKPKMPQMHLQPIEQL